jgi:tRNA threonylcarbamoyladenosine biosynthesis protein TsaE
MSSTESDTAESTISLADENATRALGADLARTVGAGTVILLDGPLGAGKTTFVQGFAEAIGAAAAASPSFVLAHHYTGGRLPVWHLDLYRIENEAEIADLDLDLYLPADGVTLVEWASRAADEWPMDRIEIQMAIDGHARRAKIRGRRGGAEPVRAIAPRRSPA